MLPRSLTLLALANATAGRVVRLGCVALAAPVVIGIALVLLASEAHGKEHS